MTGRQLAFDLDLDRGDARRLRRAEPAPALAVMPRGPRPPTPKYRAPRYLRGYQPRLNDLNVTLTRADVGLLVRRVATVRLTGAWL